MTDTTAIALVGALSAILITIPFIRRVRRRETQAHDAGIEALKYGLHEPASLHPVIDPNLCIGIASCIASCPEHDVLGLVGGQARPIQPASCVGHGLCEAACPVDAISLVFGTEARGVDLPRLQGNYETNVPGLYVIGELGGMGLIRNAFEQGRQCIDGITIPDLQPCPVRETINLTIRSRRFSKRARRRGITLRRQPTAKAGCHLRPLAPNRFLV